MTRTRTLCIGTGLLALVVGTAGTTVAAAAPDPGPPDLGRAIEVAAAAVPDGVVRAVEQDDDGTYDVEIRHDDGTETDVELSATFEVLRQEQDGVDADDADDGALDEASRTRAADAALAAVGEGEVVDVDADDGGYDVEIRHDDGSETDVDLDADFAVVRTEHDPRDD